MPREFSLSLAKSLSASGSTSVLRHKGSSSRHASRRCRPSTPALCRRSRTPRSRYVSSRRTRSRTSPRNTGVRASARLRLRRSRTFSTTRMPRERTLLIRSSWCKATSMSPRLVFLLGYSRVLRLGTATRSICHRAVSRRAHHANTRHNR